MKKIIERAEARLTAEDIEGTGQVMLNRADLQALVDAAKSKDFTGVARINYFSETLQRWADTSQRQIAAINRLLTENTALRRGQGNFPEKLDVS